ncbi:helix-turn-helix domain-containing protein [Brevibacillus porteri]|uniref:HTH cro/C1-type domain-containing protein n=1 Tax=Brevibacillus porteri TaxID=2126350 RepID=A0ABX5FQE4_9BACL|nr:helix-turn-helix domain-containing protein [Brevibacillus porteri]MED1800644.1 helix-turn-helix domain-containing protein [Brevibacillus porteri]MED2134728.1 helix-turn-helix domain-containing protein [Brevibacillus porteri]MED2745615.1 helix-turn-helix domain-containing protein [Brevibacillus porteri]MED2814747.1 helix-turn-helix domain-containing protein [Brevibacillus porteri]MED2896321.1 helix-turn-helix domain-containing protein [Brevibacillus porteri]
MPNPMVIENYRKKRNLSVKELTKLMKRTPGWYSKIKNGHFTLPSYHIEHMAEIFGVKPATLAKEYFSDSKVEETSTSDGVKQQPA